VNNAGIGDVMAFVDSDWKKQETMIRLNIESLTRLTHLFLPSFVKQGRGGILNVASTAAFQPGPYMAVYYASKSYVLNFSLALNEELKGTGVHITTLCPGPTESGFQKTANMEKSLLFKLFNVPTSEDVATYAYKAFKNKKSLAVHGLMNKIMAHTTGLAPNFILLKVVKFLNAGK
jgi:short-subunit dehydrogenase